MSIIRQEIPSYLTLLQRKSSKVKYMETFVFIILLITVYQFLGYEHTFFKISAIFSALVTLIISPIVYKILIKPIYRLTETELVIQKANKETRIPIIKIKPAYDLRYFYDINDKKILLSVSNQFLEDLNKQIEIVNKRMGKG